MPCTVSEHCFFMHWGRSSRLRGALCSRENNTNVKPTRPLFKTVRKLATVLTWRLKLYKNGCVRAWHLSCCSGISLLSIPEKIPPPLMRGTHWLGSLGLRAICVLLYWLLREIRKAMTLTLLGLGQPSSQEKAGYEPYLIGTRKICWRRHSMPPACGFSARQESYAQNRNTAADCPSLSMRSFWWSFFPSFYVVQKWAATKGVPWKVAAGSNSAFFLHRQN